jgi:Protein of unknown function (DUF3108)
MNVEMVKNLLQSKVLRVWFIAATLVVLLAGCGQPEVQPLHFGDAPWQPNETSTYQLTDLNGNHAGTARYDLTRLTEETWNLRREINAQGTQEIVAVDMSDDAFRPIESTLIRIMRDGTEVVHADYSGSQAEMELTTKLNVTTQQRVSIPSDAREHATVIMLLRALPLAEDYAVRLNVFLPVVGILDRVTVEVVGQEQVNTLANSYDTWHVRMETSNSSTEAWVATQAPYPVVKFVDSRNGGIFELSDFEPGE